MNQASCLRAKPLRLLPLIVLIVLSKVCLVLATPSRLKLPNIQLPEKMSEKVSQYEEIYHYILGFGGYFGNDASIYGDQAVISSGYGSILFKKGLSGWSIGVSVSICQECYPCGNSNMDCMGHSDVIEYTSSIGAELLALAKPISWATYPETREEKSYLMIFKRSGDGWVWDANLDSLMIYPDIWGVHVISNDSLIAWDVSGHAEGIHGLVLFVEINDVWQVVSTVPPNHFIGATSDLWVSADTSYESNKGIARVYSRSGATFGSPQDIIPSTRLDAQRFGEYGALEGSLLAISGSKGVSYQHELFIFRYEALAFVEFQILQTADFGYLGFSEMTMSGNRLAFGQSSGSGGMGGASVFEYDGINFALLDTVIPSDTNLTQDLPYMTDCRTHIALSDDWLVLSNPCKYVENAWNPSGIAYFYRLGSPSPSPSPTPTSTPAPTLSPTTSPTSSPTPSPSPIVSPSPATIPVVSNAFQLNENSGIPYDVSLAISEHGLFVGAPRANKVTIYEPAATGWSPSQVLTGSSYFGGSVAATGLTLVVGAVWSTNDSLSNVGAVSVFKLLDGTWEFMQKLVPPTPEQNMFFGYRLAVSDAFLVVSSSGGYQTKGYVWIFQYDGTTWNHMQDLPSNGPAGGRFGESLAVQGNTIIVGADGRVTAYGLEQSVWIEKQVLSPAPSSSEKPYDAYNFGWSISLSGDSLLVGAMSAYNTITHTHVGAVYEWNLVSGSWIEGQLITASDEREYAMFGRSVATDGSLLVIGASGFNNGIDVDPGDAYIFQLSESGWEQTHKINAPATNDRQFGYTTAFYGNVFGVTSENLAYAFTISSPTPTPIPTPTLSPTSSPTSSPTLVPPSFPKTDMALGKSTITVVPAEPIASPIDTSLGIPGVLGSIQISTVTNVLDLGVWSSSDASQMCTSLPAWLNQNVYDSCRRDLYESLFGQRIARGERHETDRVAYFKLSTLQFMDNSTAAPYAANVFVAYDDAFFSALISEHCQELANLMATDASSRCMAELSSVPARIIQNALSPPYEAVSISMSSVSHTTTHNEMYLSFGSKCTFNGNLRPFSFGERCCLVNYGSGSSPIHWLRSAPLAVCDAGYVSTKLVSVPIMLPVFGLFSPAQSAPVAGGVTLGGVNKCKLGSGTVSFEAKEVSLCGTIPTMKMRVKVSWPDQIIELNHGTSGAICTNDCEASTGFDMLRDLYSTSVMNALTLKCRTVTASLLVNANSANVLWDDGCPAKPARNVLLHMRMGAVLGDLTAAWSTELRALIQSMRDSLTVTGMGIRDNNEFTMLVKVNKGSVERDFIVNASIYTSTAKPDVLTQSYVFVQPYKYMAGALNPHIAANDDASVDTFVSCP